MKPASSEGRKAEVEEPEVQDAADGCGERKGRARRKDAGAEGLQKRPDSGTRDAGNGTGRFRLPEPTDRKELPVRVPPGSISGL